MDNKAIIFSGLSLITGAVIGFVVGYNVNKRQVDEERRMQEEAAEALKEYQKKSEEEAETEQPVIKTVVKAAKIATPTEPGINYTKYAEMKAEEAKKAEAESPSEDDDEDEEKELDPPMETYEERLEREGKELTEQDEIYNKKKGDKIDVLGNEDIDNEYPEVHYPAEELYYFTDDDVLTDEDGNIVDEEEYIGTKLRRFGWMTNPQEAVWIRNNPKETDFHVNKVKDTRDSWFSQ